MGKPNGLGLRGGKSLLNCPHCDSVTSVRSSRMITPLYKHCNMQCTNFECGHTFAVAVEFLHTISLSACARADLHLPTAPPRSRAVPAIANDNGAAPPLPLAGEGRGEGANDNHLGATSTGGAETARGVGVPPPKATGAVNDDDQLGEAVNI